MAVLLLGILSGLCHASTPAGTSIDHRVELTYQSGNTEVSTQSNLVNIIVQEIIDANILSQDSHQVTANPGEQNIPLKFLLTNEGNGNEAFKLVASNTSVANEFNVALGNLYIDDGDGVFTEANETLLSTQTTDPLPPNTPIVLWQIVDTPAQTTRGTASHIRLEAQSTTFIPVTGPYAPQLGDLQNNLGDGGTQAIYGSDQSIFAEAGVLISEIQVRITKSIVSTPYIPGERNAHLAPLAEVDYKLQVTIAGTGTVENLIVTDPLPAELKLKDEKLGTVTVNGTSYTAQKDSDPVSYTNDVIEVELGSVNAPATIDILFTTIIQ